MSRQPPQQQSPHTEEKEEEEEEEEEESSDSPAQPPRRASELTSTEEGESSSRRGRRARSHEERRRVYGNEGGVWPEPFVEALAREVALEAARSGGALAAAPAVANVFQMVACYGYNDLQRIGKNKLNFCKQNGKRSAAYGNDFASGMVCSTWRTISNSEILWKSLTRLVWSQNHRRSSQWRDEYIRLHRTASNFYYNRAKYTLIEYEVSSDSSNNGAGAACRCLALSSTFLAGGFFDGAVRIFSLATKECISTMKPVHENRLGPLSRAIAGIVLYDDKVVFASFDGSVFVGSISRGEIRCAHVGNVVNDGTLVDFTGCEDWWVGLYAGVPRHACHIWDASTEELVFNGGDITDPDALRGWHLLTEQAERIGRVRIGDDGLLLTATRLKVAVFDLETHGSAFSIEEETAGEVIVESVEVNADRFLMASSNGVARIRQVRTLEDVCSFPFDGAGGLNGNNNNNNNYRKLLGTLNTRQAFVCIDGVVGAWDANSGARLYRLTEQIGDVFDLVADDEHVAGCALDTGIHLWSFGP
eukprot:Gb_09541 [translate_table: standard]